MTFFVFSLVFFLDYSECGYPFQVSTCQVTDRLNGVVHYTLERLKRLRKVRIDFVIKSGQSFERLNYIVSEVLQFS
jgi:metal-sulfur cluster biosynthetic enzyme